MKEDLPVFTSNYRYGRDKAFVQAPAAAGLEVF